MWSSRMWVVTCLYESLSKFGVCLWTFSLPRSRTVLPYLQSQNPYMAQKAK